MLEIESYSVKTAKNGQKIPVVNGVHLHSIYNPEKECESIIKQFQEQLANKSEILILGLGYGYHVLSLYSYMKSIGHEAPNIFVIEPNEDVYRDALKFNELSSNNIKIFCTNDVSKLYEDKEIINLLMRKPVVIPHAPSFSLYKDFFREYLSYKAPRSLDRIGIKIESEALSLYLSQFNDEKSIDDCFLEVSQRTSFKNKFDLAFIAFSKVCQQTERMN